MLTEQQIADIEKRIDELENSVVDSRGGSVECFSICLDEINFSRFNSEGEETRRYRVEIIDNEVPDEYEWDTDTDGGYGSFRRLPREVQDIVAELIKLNGILEHNEKEVEEAEWEDMDDEETFTLD